MPGIQIVKFPSEPEVAGPYTVSAATGVSNTETVAFTILVPEAKLGGGPASVGANTQGTLYIKYVPASLTNCKIRIYGSYLTNPASTDWYSESFEVDTTSAPTTTATISEFLIDLGTVDYSGATNGPIAWHFPLGAYKSLKVTVQSVGTITSSALTLTLGLRTN
jgi:hypothetical protein